MTITSTQARYQSAGNGATRAFYLPAVILAPADIALTLTDSTGNIVAATLNGAQSYDYTVTGVQDAATGEYSAGATVTFNTAPPNGYLVTLLVDPSPTQSLVLPASGPLPPAGMQAALDKLTMEVLALRDRVSRVPMAPAQDPVGNGMGLPNAASRAGRVLGFDSSGQPAVAGAGSLAALASLQALGTITALGTLGDIGSINVLDVGAKGDGVTDDTAAFNAAIAAAAAAGPYCTVRVPRVSAGYVISSTLTINHAVRLVGDGWEEDTANANGSATPGSTLLWAGGNTPMIRITSATPGNFLMNGAVLGIALNGAGLASEGIHGSSLCHWRFDVSIAGVTANGLNLADDNSALTAFNRVKLRFTWGVAAASQPANGLLFAATSWGCAQNIAEQVSGLIYNGAMVAIIGGDNNHIEHLHVSVQAPGTGTGLGFFNGGPSGAANNNLADYVVGPVFADTLSIGNRILSLVSEGGGVALNGSAGGQLDYSVVDYAFGTGAVFDTPHLKMWDRLWLPASGWSVTGAGGAAAQAAGLWPGAIALAAGAVQGAGMILPPPLRWSAGNVTYLVVAFNMDAANTGANVRLRLRMNHIEDGNTMAAAAIDQTFTVAVHNAQYSLTLAGLLLAPPMPRSQTDCLFLRLDRVGTDALDTAAGNLDLLGAGLVFQSSGPVSPGAGTYALPLLVPAGSNKPPQITT